MTDNIKRYGTRKEVWEGTAMQTKSKLKKDDLALSKKGNPTSKKAIESARARIKDMQKRMCEKMGYVIGQEMQKVTQEIAKVEAVKEPPKPKPRPQKKK